MKLTNEQIDYIATALSNLGTVGFLGAGVAVFTVERLLRSENIAVAFL